MSDVTSTDAAEKERLDRNLEEMLRELRLALPGVTVLLGFLLALPFQARFAEVTGFQESVYFGSLLMTAASILLLVAPGAYHRLTFRHQMKAHLVPLGNRLAILGLVTLAFAITGVVVLVTDFLYGPMVTIIVGATCGLLFAVIWFALPLSARIEK